MKKLRDIIQAIRVRQWVKNLLVFAALAFSGNLLSRELIYRSALCFLGFCLVSGAVYLINDIFDREKDRLHPDKINRAIASGRVKTWEALLLA